MDEEQDQASELRKLINKVEVPDTEKTREKKENEREIDILNLPPRKEIHHSKKSKTRIKLNSPVLRLIFVIVLMMVVIAGAIYLFVNDGLKFTSITFSKTFHQYMSISFGDK